MPVLAGNLNNFTIPEIWMRLTPEVELGMIVIILGGDVAVKGKYILRSFFSTCVLNFITEDYAAGVHTSRHTSLEEGICWLGC